MTQSCQRHISKWSASEAILGVLFLACGCAIYLLFRSTSLNIYQWCCALGLSSPIDTLREQVQTWSISEFIKYSLPDGLYCAAYILIIDAIWHKDDTLVKYLIISIIPLVTIGSELLQYLGMVQGTFDIFDLICYSMPPMIYVLTLIIRSSLTN